MSNLTSEEKLPEPEDGYEWVSIGELSNKEAALINQEVIDS